MRGVGIAGVLLLSACVSLWMPGEDEINACAASYVSESGVPRPHIPHAEWEARKAECAACLIRGGTVSSCAGTYP